MKPRSRAAAAAVRTAMRSDGSRTTSAAKCAQQVRAAYIGYVAYFGTYDVAADGSSLVHYVEGSLNPDWVGGEQRRALRFDGDRLILSAEVRKHDATVTHSLTWERC